MKGQRLLDGTLCGFAPETLDAMRQAFDLSWTLLAKRYRHEEGASAARINLANVIVALTEHGNTDPPDIARMANDLINF